MKPAMRPRLTGISRMPVRSMRLPDALWLRLEATTAEVNRRRRRRISTSSVIRALIERALDEPGDALDFDAKISRPTRVVQSQKVKRAAANAERELGDLFKDVSDAVDRLQLTPAEFARAVGGNRRDLERFYHRGAFPDSDAMPFISRIQEWLLVQAEARAIV